MSVSVLRPQQWQAVRRWWRSAPAVPHHSPDAEDRPRFWIAKSVNIMENTKKVPESRPHGVNACMHRQGAHGVRPLLSWTASLLKC